MIKDRKRQQGDVFQSREYDGVRFIYHIDSPNLNSPYVYRCMDDGPLEVLGRSTLQDYSLLTYVDSIYTNHELAQKINNVCR